MALAGTTRPRCAARRRCGCVVESCRSSSTTGGANGALGQSSSLAAGRHQPKPACFSPMRETPDYAQELPSQRVAQSLLLTAGGSRRRAHDPGETIERRGEAPRGRDKKKEKN